MAIDAAEANGRGRRQRVDPGELPELVDWVGDGYVRFFRTAYLIMGNRNSSPRLP
jgi:hypothetical protein